MSQIALNLLQELIACPSVTPNDAGCQDLLAKKLNALGFSIEHFRFKDVDNLWASFGDVNEQPLVVFLGHTDVVPPGDEQAWQTPPFSAVIKNDVLYGRGAADMKSGIAAMFEAIEGFLAANNNKFNGSIGLLLTSDEEGPAIHGVAKMMEILTARNINIKYCIVGEPSSQAKIGDTVHHGRRGSMTAEINIMGRQGHVAYPEQAINPIHMAWQALGSLSELTWKSQDDFCDTSLQWTKIHSDSKAENVIPNQLAGRFNLRFAPPWTPDNIKERIISHLENYPLHFDINWRVNGLPFYTKEGILTAACRKAIKEATGNEPIFSTIGGTSDGRFVAPFGAEVVELGPISTSMHQVNEHIHCKDLKVLVAIYKNLLNILLK